ncbi:hypothetical protein [Baekduia soli]|nr:hypothetical protein [Baekduia soli]
MHEIDVALFLHLLGVLGLVSGVTVAGVASPPCAGAGRPPRSRCCRG